MNTCPKELCGGVGAECFREHGVMPATGWPYTHLVNDGVVDRVRARFAPAEPGIDVHPGINWLESDQEFKPEAHKCEDDEYCTGGSYCVIRTV